MAVPDAHPRHSECNATEPRGFQTTILRNYPTAHSLIAPWTYMCSAWQSGTPTASVAQHSLTYMGKRVHSMRAAHETYVCSVRSFLLICFVMMCYVVLYYVMLKYI